MYKILFHILGISPALIFGDTLVLDRWLWLSRRLPRITKSVRLLDVGCGSGTFTIAASVRGYDATGISFDEIQNNKARLRNKYVLRANAEFLTLDIRRLDEHVELKSGFDIVICLETIEHILNDRKLMADMYACLKPGGYIFLTAPYYYYKAITKDENGPFSELEDGGHVRRGYTEESFGKLCADAGFLVENYSYCSGFLSQMLTKVLRYMSHIHYIFGWLFILLPRVLPPIIDPLINLCRLWPNYSITVVARKPVPAMIGAMEKI